MTLERVIKRMQGKQVAPKAKSEHKSQDSSAKSLKKAIDKYLKEQSDGTSRRNITGFHPSYEAIEQARCVRWWYLLFNDAESSRTIDARLRRIFDNGHDVHERYTEYFDSMGILLDKEIPVRIDSPVPVVGHADAVINWNGKKLVELKSINPEGFAMRRMYGKPKKDHYLQAQIYMYALSLEEGYVIYEDKGYQHIEIFHLQRDDDVMNKYFKKRAKTYKFIVEGKMPDRPYERDSKICSSCDLQDYCWNKMLP